MKDINLNVSKKVAEGDYYTDRDDFVANHELVVTITLHEYRELVAENVKRNETESMNYTLRQELKKAREEIEALKVRIAKMETYEEPEFFTEVPFDGEDKKESEDA